jgi:hypothetical protein
MKGRNVQKQMVGQTINLANNLKKPVKICNIYLYNSINFLSNCLCIVDWIVADYLAIRQGSLGSLRYVLKDGLRYLPLYGFYFAQVCNI